MAVAMDKCTARVRVRDAREDDVKEKEKEKENKCLLYMETFPRQNLI